MAEISTHEYCQHIEDMIEQGLYAQAAEHGKHILKQYPKHVATYELLGKAMLEAGRNEYAADMFHRVLSADPENLVAWVGMSEIHNRRGELDAAVWHLERAFELAADNEVVKEELRHLYGQRDGVEPQRVQLTRGALARLYLRGDLLSRAIGEFRALLADNPERVDLNVALAEALWRNEQRLEASEACQQVLDVLPYCLKANLILGEIWTISGREEGQTYLRRAEAVDPENRMAQELFGAASPLPPQEAWITPLKYRPSAEEERPAWMAEMAPGAIEEAPRAEGEAALVDAAAALEAQIEIPPWLEEVVGEEPTVPTPPGLAGPLEEQPPEEAIPAPAEEVPEWLAGIGEEFIEEEPGAVTEEETPEWLAGLGLESIGEEEEEEEEEKEVIPEWPAEPGVEPTGIAEVPAAPGEEEVPEWLADLGVEAPGAEVTPSVPPTVPPTEQLPDWLAGIREQFTEEVEAPEEAPTPVEEVPTPAWLEGEGLPSGDEALAWLEQLAEGKEEELRAQAQAEAEARMAEIMGRPTPAEVPPVEAAPEEPVAPPVEEAVAPPVEEAFGWTAFGEPEAAPPEALEEAQAPIPAAEEAPTPAWLEGEGLPSGDEALAWLEQLAEGKEEELRARAQAEAEARMAEIMGRPTPAEVPPVEAAPEEPVTPPVEEAVAAMEKAPPVEEVTPPEVPEAAYPEEVEAPPVVEFPVIEEAPPPEAEPFAAERAYLKDHPRDYEAWLALARALWQASERQAALEAYNRVIRSGKLLESVIPDLKEYLEQWPAISMQRVLGDAYMKDGQLQVALDIYRRALEAL
jgi:tetratricopeptide (TPR) repeat protein